MSKRSRFLLVMAVLIGSGVVIFWPGVWRPYAFANVTLVSFTADTLVGQPEIYIHWETATELDTAGFYVNRSGGSVESFARVSDFIVSQDEANSGARYVFTDTTTVLNHTYYYKLEEITKYQQSIFYGPITITAGIPAMVPPTPTASPTVTRTPTRTPTITPTPSATTKVEPTKSSPGGSFATPQLATGSTITPLPTVVNVVVTNPAPTTKPQVFATAALPTNTVVSQPVSILNTPVPAASNGPTTNQVTPAPAALTVAQAPDPSLASAALAQAQVAPVVVVTEAGASSTPENAANTTLPLLFVIVVLLLGGGLTILLQARK